MKAGFARADITPEAGVPMEGLYQRSVSQTVHDPLYVRALVLTDDDDRMLILSFDLLFFEQKEVDRIKGAIGLASGFRNSQILINTTHTHTGPRITRWAYSGAPDSDYVDRLVVAAVEVANEALAGTRDVTFESGVGQTSLPVSRRMRDEQGKARWFPNFEEPTYREVPFCAFRDDSGSVVSLIFSAACHPSMIYEFAISAEYPGVAMEQLNAHFGMEGAIFLQGAAGDTKPRPVADPEKGWVAGTWEQMETVGRELAEVVIDGLAEIHAEPGGPLKSVLTTVDWPLEPIPERATFEAMLSGDAEPNPLRRAWAADMLARYEGMEPNFPIGLQIVQLSEHLRIVGVEGEVLAELGLRIREIFPVGVTFVLGYCNATRLYLPASEQLAAGGYEVESYWEYHCPSPPAPGCERPLLIAIENYAGGVRRSS